MDDGSKEVKYVVMGEEGFYTFEDTWEDLPRQIGWLTHNGFILIGVDGLNGFHVGVPNENS